MYKQNILIALLLITITATLYYKKRLYQLETQHQMKKESTLKLAHKVAYLAKDIRIATYPTDCDEVTREIIGESCDLGNYMEWAGPELESEAGELLILLNDAQNND
ncbi:MAG: hypothetical protein WBF77_07280 [Sulfurimonadaceae bacterium]